MTSDEAGHRVVVVIEMPITQHVLCSVSGLMVRRPDIRGGI